MLLSARKNERQIKFKFLYQVHILIQNLNNNSCED